MAHCRQNPEDFTRKRLLSFPCLCLLILRGHKVSLQNVISKVFKAMGDLFSAPTNSAYCRARQKIKPEVFSHLNQGLTENFYRLSQDDGQFRKWRGHRLVATDGTFLNLPDTPETRRKYTLQTNQIPGAECVQALCCVLYDVQNDLGLKLHMSKRQGETRTLIEYLWQATKNNDVLVLDRAYADYGLIAFAQARGREVVIRLPRDRFSECESFWESDAPEQWVEISLPSTASTRAFVRHHQLATKVRVRLVRVILSSGETEVLLTTLLDPVAYPAAEFKQVYHWRWNEETFFNRYKNIFEVERFGGKNLTSIEQDVHGTFLLMTLESILSRPEQESLAEESVARATKHIKQVNRAESYVALLDRLVELLVSSQSEEQVLKELHHLFRKNPTLKRPGRQFPRKPPNYSKAVRHHKHKKRILA
jgi:Transposase DDE domain